MKKVQDLLKLKPDSEKLNLSLMQIESINDLIFEIFHFHNLKELDLSCNRIKSLPKDLSILKTIQRLDVSNNLFLDLEQVFFSLATMPSLIELNITYDPSNLKHTIGYYLPKLEVINGEIIKMGGEAKIENPIVTVKNGKVDIDRSKSSRITLTHGFLFFDEELANLRNFMQNVNIIGQEYTSNSKLPNTQLKDQIRQVEDLVRSSYDFNDKVINKCIKGEISKNVETFQEKLEFLQELFGVYNNFIREKQPRIAAANDNVFNMLYVLIDNLKRQAPHLQAEPTKGKDMSVSAFKEAKSTNGLEKPIDLGLTRPVVNENNNEKTLLRLKLKELEKEVQDLRMENEEIYKTLINDTKKEVLNFTKKINTLKTVNKIEAVNIEDSKKKQVLSLKGYSKRQVNDLILDIMTQKKAHDDKCLRTKQPIITIENFLFIYFSTKYGLKDMIMVEVTSAIDRINSYAESSVEVEIFRRIIRNEVDEKFYWMVQSLKQGLKSKLDAYYREKVKKNALQTEINTFTASKLSGSLNRKEAEYLLTTSYPGKDQQKVLSNFGEYFDLNCNDNNELDYSLFTDYIFKYELDLHLQYVSHISQFFINTDNDKNGVITRKQFLQLMDTLSQRDVRCNFEAMIDTADPVNSNNITFSKVIEVLGANFTDKEKKVNLIQFLNSV